MNYQFLNLLKNMNGNIKKIDFLLNKLYENN